MILLVFAMAVGTFTTKRIASDFETQSAARFDLFQRRLKVTQTGGGRPVVNVDALSAIGVEATTALKVWQVDNRTGSTRQIAPIGYGSTVNLGSPDADPQRIDDLRIETRRIRTPVVDANGNQKAVEVERPAVVGTSAPGSFGTMPTVGTVRTQIPVTADLIVRVGRSYDAVERTTRRVWSALALGVVGGTFLALIAGLALGARAMRPVRRMTHTARHIARTRDLDAKMPPSKVHDEIAELSGTLQDMLDELAASQATVDATLQRQREFIADASHELRTPLTSVQANLELLALTTTGDDQEAAESALRSSRRMRRLVADLLLLARMDASRETERADVDLDRAILEAVDELEPQIGDHEVALDLDPVTLDGIRDELVRMVANLVGNALRHTPSGTEIRVRLRATGTHGELVVEDDGPGIPVELRARIFDRFVRRGGEGAGSTGIGLAIVRAAAQRHGGDVRVEATDEATGLGARFVVTMAVRATVEPTGTLADEAGGTLWAGGSEEDSASRRVVRRIRSRLRAAGRPTTVMVDPAAHEADTDDDVREDPDAPPAGDEADGEGAPDADAGPADAGQDERPDGASRLDDPDERR
ncbi:sensor histidine kinase [Patulibacter minatonensis]|uniref:sensor histidine kinase n=1 Tax=Patulibacter minatonensis TaxID=298163 RepID=UPI0012F862BE|nr:HAMP domain-containing sensor histidine kinase [Patulibacter minatonensis]